MKIIRIKVCADCPFVYPHPMPLEAGDVNVCGHEDVMSELPGWNDRIVKKTRIPDFCPLENETQKKTTKKKESKKNG